MAALAIAAGLAAATAMPAAAGGPIGNGMFGISPAAAADGRSLPYFTMTLAPGRSATDTAIVSNQSKTTEVLRIDPSVGVTAANGGAAYEATFTGCSGPGCWITGLPARVTLAPGTAKQLRFTMHVPPGAPPGQYLAGISAEPATRPKPVRIGSNGRAAAQAIVVDQVTVGVAVTVGRLAALHSQFQIPAVTGQDIGTIARLNIRLNNTGQRFSHAAGQASCTAGGAPHSFAVTAGTVLPHQGALIAVNAPGLPEGATVPCTIRLRYAAGQVVTWSGQVAIPAAPRTRTVRNGQGSYSIVPIGGGVPLWAWLLGALLAVVLLLGVAMLVLYYRRGHARSSSALAASVGPGRKARANGLGQDATNSSARPPSQSLRW